VSLEQIRADEQATCTGYGFEAGSPDFANCMMTVDQARRNREAAAANVWDAQVYSTGLQPQQPPQIPDYSDMGQWGMTMGMYR
jgi:hypothetical protein